MPQSHFVLRSSKIKRRRLAHLAAREPPMSRGRKRSIRPVFPSTSAAVTNCRPETCSLTTVIRAEGYAAFKTRSAGTIPGKRVGEPLECRRHGFKGVDLPGGNTSRHAEGDKPPVGADVQKNRVLIRENQKQRKKRFPQSATRSPPRGREIFPCPSKRPAQNLPRRF